ncbi:MAG: hypothetical protein CVV59_00020 [Tenericutes bacterium HGW-Tenericutes-4]|nr:MAG: hypothetical protein CVV59_00020 [Tenericutes bacterium HGW-Tenericutes-4]
MNKKTYCRWKDEEVKSLFSHIDSFKQKNLPLTYAFLEYAKLTGRKSNSVRNYYYLELDELLQNESRRASLNIDLTNHQKQNFQEFTKKEEQDLVYYILQKARYSKSVRNSCLALANNDVSLMIRYQNKFRSLLKNNPSLIEEINKKLDATIGPKQVTKKENNVLLFPVLQKNKIKEKLSDDELRGLFMGLVKLVKKSADLEISTALKKECNFANENLRKTLIAMRKKEEEIMLLTEKNEALNGKLKTLEDQMIKLRIKAFENMQKNKN